MYWSPVTAEKDGFYIKNRATCDNDDKEMLGSELAPKLTDERKSRLINLTIINTK